MWSKFKTDEKGFTGLEAAIVLVAFVVVAAVFSYVMLGAGFFTTQKSQEVVHTGVTQASSSLAPSGDVIVVGNAANTIPTIILYVTNTAGGTSVDLDKTVVTYTDSDDYVSKEYAAAGANGWTYTEVIAETGSAVNLVDKGEKYRIELTLATLGATTLPAANEGIKIEVKPPEGAVLVLTRTMPPAIEDATNYVVY
jgi:archaeal flagellin FlaB